MPPYAQPLRIVHSPTDHPKSQSPSPRRAFPVLSPEQRVTLDRFHERLERASHEAPETTDSILRMLHKLLDTMNLP